MVAAIRYALVVSVAAGTYTEVAQLVLDSSVVVAGRRSSSKDCVVIRGDDDSASYSNGFITCNAASGGVFAFGNIMFRTGTQQPSFFRCEGSSAFVLSHC